MITRQEQREGRADSRARKNRGSRTRHADSGKPLVQKSVRDQLLAQLTGRAMPVWKTQKQLEEEARGEKPIQQGFGQDSFTNQGFTSGDVLRQIRGE